MAKDSASLAKELASLAKKQSNVAEGISNTIVVQPQAYAAIAESQTYLEAVGDPKFSHQ